MKKRIFSLILTALMLLSTALMTACSNNSAEETNETAQSNTTAQVSVETDDSVATEELSDYEQRQLIPDNLPDVKFNGADFRILTHTNQQYYEELMADELTGEGCNDAIFNRNLTVETRYDIKMSVEQDGDPQNVAKTMATAGTLDYHLVGQYDYQASTPITAKALLNWYEVPHVDLDKPWHNKLANDDATINGTLYCICSDLSITSMTYTNCIFTNIDMLADHGYTQEDMYGIVKEGKWTIDYFSNLISTMYTDENGNGKADSQDTYGFAYNTINPADVWFNAFGGKMTGRDEEGNVTVTFMSDKTVSMLAKLLDLHYKNPGYEKLPNQYDEEKFFPNQRMVFAAMRFYAAFTSLREMDASYTMLPYPKWDEAQDAYYTNADDKFTVFDLPTPAYAELDYIGTIFEALSAESYKKVYPEYYDVALKGKYSNDETTAEMIELIMDGRMFDFAFQFGSSFQDIPYMFRNLINENNPNIISKYQSIQKALNKTLERGFVKYYGMDG